MAALRQQLVVATEQLSTSTAAPAVLVRLHSLAALAGKAPSKVVQVAPVRQPLSAEMVALGWFAQVQAGRTTEQAAVPQELPRFEVVLVWLPAEATTRARQVV